MKIKLSLSSKKDFNGLSEILLSTKVRIGDRVTTLRAKSEVYVSRMFFSQEKGIDMSRKKVIAADVRRLHIEAKEKLEDILSAVARAEQAACKADITADWLKATIERHLHPERFNMALKRATIYDMAQDYIVGKGFDKDYIKRFTVLLRTIARYEGFVRATDKERKDFSFNPEELTKDGIDDFRDYLRNEEQLSQEYKALFRRLLSEYPVGMTVGRKELEVRGENYVINLLKKLKTFLNWLYDEGMISRRPFDGYQIGTQKYGTPYYITIAERNHIADAPMPTKHLETQRDIFIFQCYVGCRVSDLMKLTERNITEGVLVYTPHKTKDDGVQSVQARVPLHPKAVALIEKYRGLDEHGRLFPFISSQKYNDAIKDVFTVAGITRSVEVRNAKTGEMELCPINEIASSHLARRTFVGNAYKQVSDPNIIGKMSGHVEGSKAFSRYRNIDDETLKNVIDRIG